MEEIESQYLLSREPSAAYSTFVFLPYDMEILAQFHETFFLKYFITLKLCMHRALRHLNNRKWPGNTWKIVCHIVIAFPIMISGLN